MASSEKTPGLSLNRWLGGDIPQREDFVRDNQIIDEAITGLQKNAGSGGEAPGLAAHIADLASHLSKADRGLLERILPVSGYYQGNGEAMQVISTGFKPLFGVVFATAKPMAEMGGGGGYHTIRFGFITELADSFGVQSTSTGFRVFNNTGSSAGATYQGLNTGGITYIYYLWK
ncbi:MAG: hypothetical protein LBU86_02340 [Oscillospiraceae bacterium]|jgi:hypothetical protein|nr:hypothetical protein [Oscillospiraceae bacterium]